MTDSLVAALRGGFINRHVEKRYQALLDARCSRWSISTFIISFFAVAVGLARFREVASAAPAHTLLLIVAKTIEGSIIPFQKRMGRHAFVAVKGLLHRPFQLAYLLRLVQWSPVANTYIVGGNIEFLVSTGLLAIAYPLSVPLDFHQHILSRLAIDGLVVVFFLQVQQREGIKIPTLERVLLWFTLAIVCGLVNDVLRRAYFLKTLAIEQQLQAVGSVQQEGCDKKMPRAAASYIPTMRQQKVTIRITTPHGDEGIMASMESDRIRRRVLEELRRSKTVLLNYSVRKGSVIVEIEAYLPKQEEDHNDYQGVDVDVDILEIDFEAWLRILKVQDVSTLSDGSLVTVSIGARSRVFSYSKSHDSWTPLHEAPILSPLVPVMTSLLSRIIPCCTILNASPAAREVVFSAIWLHDQPLTIRSLQEVGISMDATIGGMPIPLRVQPACPCDWKHGQLVNFLVQLPGSCKPGPLRVNLWSSVDPSTVSTSISHSPRIVAASQTFLVLPPECGAMSEELDHLRCSKTLAPSGIDDLLNDIGQLVSLVNDCHNASPDVLASMKVVQEGLVSYCEGDLPHTLDYITKVDLSTPPSHSTNISPLPLPVHTLWLWFNIGRYTLHGSYVLKTNNPSAQLALLVYSILPYVLMLMRCPPFSHPRLGSFTHWMFFERAGPLLCCWKAAIVAATSFGFVPPIVGTPYDPQSPSSKNFWPYLTFLALLTDAMEACHFNLANSIAFFGFLQASLIFLYGTTVMGMPRYQTLLLSIGLACMRIILSVGVRHWSRFDDNSAASKKNS